MLMLYAVQRPSDCLSMTTSRIREMDNRLYISLRQQKTGDLLNVPVHGTLEPLLRERLAPDWKPETLSNQRTYSNTTATLLLVPSPTGKPWAYRNFCRAWDLITRETGIEGLQRRDLRRTGIVRLAEAGASRRIYHGGPKWPWVRSRSGKNAADATKVARLPSHGRSDNQ